MRLREAKPRTIVRLKDGKKLARINSVGVLFGNKVEKGGVILDRRLGAEGDAPGLKHWHYTDLVKVSKEEIEEAALSY